MRSVRVRWQREQRGIKKFNATMFRKDLLLKLQNQAELSYLAQTLWVHARLKQGHYLNYDLQRLCSLASYMKTKRTFSVFFPFAAIQQMSITSFWMFIDASARWIVNLTPCRALGSISVAFFFVAIFTKRSNRWGETIRNYPMSNDCASELFAFRTPFPFLMLDSKPFAFQ